MKNTKIIIFVILILTVSCRDGKNFHPLEITNSIEIIETEDAIIKSLKQAEFLNNDTLLILSSRNEITALDLNTGKLSPFLKLDLKDANNIFNFVRKQLPDTPFFNDTLNDLNNTLQISGFQIEDNLLFVSVTTQYYVLGFYDDLTAKIFKFFSLLHQYNLNSKEIENQYLFPTTIKLKYTKDDDYRTNDFISPNEGTYIDLKNSIIYSKNSPSPISDSSSFLTSFEIKDWEFINKRQLPLYYEKEKQRRLDDNFSPFSFYNRKEKVFCTEGKDIFELTPTPRKFKNIIDDKFFSIKNFVVLENNDVLYSLSCDTSKYLSVNYLRDSTHYELIQNTDEKKLFILQKGIHSITLKDDKYYFETYEEF